MKSSGTLIIFGGLPGTGKTTLAREIARRTDGVFLRIDTIEQVLRDAAGMTVGNEGYLVAYEIAADNLRNGKTVIADSVNPIPVTRDAWRGVAARTGATAVEVEIICSDKDEHRQRIETRKPDIAGHALPTWQDVEKREYDVWETAGIVIDTSGRSAAACADEIMRALEALPRRP